MSNLKSKRFKTVKTIPDEDDRYIKALPKKLKNYILFDCPVNFSPKSIYKLYRQLGCQSLCISQVKMSVLRDTEKMYEGQYPHA